MSKFSPADMAVLRRSAARYHGSGLPTSIGAKLRLCFERFIVLRDRGGRVAGFGREGFVLTPSGSGLYTWHEEAVRQSHINERLE